MYLFRMNLLTLLSILLNFLAAAQIRLTVSPLAIAPTLSIGTQRLSGFPMSITPATPSLIPTQATLRQPIPLTRLTLVEVILGVVVTTGVTRGAILVVVLEVETLGVTMAVMIPVTQPAVDRPGVVVLRVAVVVLAAAPPSPISSLMNPASLKPSARRGNPTSKA